MNRLRRLYAALLLVTLCSLLSFAQTPAPAPQPAKRFLMWKVTSPTTTVYLVGSMHLITKDVYPLPAAVEKAFAESKVLGVELDVKRLDQAKMWALIQQNAMYPPGDTLSKHLSKETADGLQEFCTKYRVPAADLEPMRPWFVSMMVGMIPMQRAGADPKSGIDMHFLDAVKETQSIAELETAEYQIGILANRPAEEQERMLAYSLKNVSKTREIEQAYLAADTDRILKLMAEAPFAEFMAKVIDERNVGMTAKIDGFLKTKDTHFVVVGAAHVIGDKGVAKLLEQKGYKVERMSYEW